MQMFARYRVPEYWIVDPASEAIEVYELGPAGYDLRVTATGDTVIRSRILSGHEFPVRSLFPVR
jgi:Uma2 family endonuclease